MHGPQCQNKFYVTQLSLLTSLFLSHAMKLHKQNLPNNLVTDLATVPN